MSTTTSNQAQEEILKEQVAAKAKQAASVAAASGNVVKGAFLATITESKTVGEKAVVFGSLAGIVSFFLPWASLLGTVSASGFLLARQASAWFWLYPASMAICFLTAWHLINAAPEKRILAARWFMVVGTLWFAPALVLISNVFSGAAGFGMYMVTASAGALLVGGLLQISDRVRELAGERA